LPGRLGESVHQYEEAIRLKPDYVAARCNLGNALNALGRVPEAVAQYEEAVRLMPADSTIRMNFAVVLLNAPGRRADAVENLREAVRLDPGNRAARGILSRLGAAGP
jgi:Flp pilus assembly protein TadD